ncbi:uncharacterized protein F4812DRAFT_423281 [Daldinia caldariorum]|uniref:uncharacterized protein n=1 Tax=Daldinia caldariorum TaxID=326644 RepID=UPI002007B15E|nr:uncharacterized protein F4812DRAFT_423281 [Daldinia caldariorum]KAI1469485.1 hypothetical protein F4812DRAFT_423281 [Daldinia caldariorum]
MAHNTAPEFDSNVVCPHNSDGRGAPVCWDCAEGGRLGRAGEDSPAPEYDDAKKRFVLRGGGSKILDNGALAPELHPPAEGIEIGSPDPRTVPPGKEVFHEPQTINALDDYTKDKHDGWNAEANENAATTTSKPQTILGFRKRVFWLLLISMFVVAFVGAAVGAAVGVTQRNQSIKASSATPSPAVGENQTTGPSNPTTTPPTTPSSSSSTSGKPTATPSAAARSCLGADGSIYTDPGTGAKFRIECDVAHQGRDIENLKASSMPECVSLCAKNTRCTGAIWYDVGPQGTDLNYCWLKSSMDDSDIRSTTDAQSVVRL